MKQLGIDGHTLIGGSGILATVVASNINVWLCAATGIATFTYMTLRAVREWIKLRHDLKAEEKYEIRTPKSPGDRSVL